MAEDQAASKGSDLTKGIALSDLVNDRLAGHVEDEEVLVVRTGTKVFAIGAHCTHYHGPLADGIVTGEAVRCPWHHACFDLNTGEAVRAPGLSPIECWSVEQRDGKVFVRDVNAERANIRLFHGGYFLPIGLSARQAGHAKLAKAGSKHGVTQKPAAIIVVFTGYFGCLH